jgi:hypothetical protein
MQRGQIGRPNNVKRRTERVDGHRTHGTSFSVSLSLPTANRSAPSTHSELGTHPNRASDTLQPSPAPGRSHEQPTSHRQHKQTLSVRRSSSYIVVASDETQLLRAM